MYERTRAQQAAACHINADARAAHARPLSMQAQAYMGGTKHGGHDSSSKHPMLSHAKGRAGVAKLSATAQHQVRLLASFVSIGGSFLLRRAPRMI